MNLKQGCFVSLAIFGIATLGYGQEKKDTIKLSVLDAQKYAIENNRSVKSAKIDIEMAKKKIWETTAIGLPQFTATADYQHTFNPPIFSFPSSGLTQNKLTGADALGENLTQFPLKNTDLNQYVYTDPSSGSPITPENQVTFNFTVSQLVFSGEYLVGLQASRVYKELSDKSFIKTELSTRESVATSYYTVLIIYENLKVLEESLKVMDQIYMDISKMNTQGLNEETDVDQMKINKSNLQTVVTSLKGQQDVALKLLKFQIGLDFSQPLILTDSMTGIVEQGNFQFLSSYEFNTETNIDYQLMQTQENLMALSYKREKSKYLPTISAFYRHTKLLNEPLINFQPKNIVGASLSLPIFTSGSRNSKTGQARLDFEKARLNKETVNQSLVMEYDRARNDYQTAFSNFSSNKESMELSRKIYNTTVIKYRAGVASSLDLTQNQNQFLTTESNYYNSVLNLLNAKAKLDRILSKY